MSPVFAIGVAKRLKGERSESILVLFRDNFDAINIRMPKIYAYVFAGLINPALVEFLIHSVRLILAVIEDDDTNRSSDTPAQNPGRCVVLFALFRCKSRVVEF